MYLTLAKKFSIETSILKNNIKGLEDIHDSDCSLFIADLTSYKENKLPDFIFHKCDKKIYKIIICQEVSNITFHRLNQSGVMGYLTTESSTRHLYDAIASSKNQTPYFCDNFRTKNSVINKHESHDTNLHELLSSREMDVAKMLAEELSIQEIAKALAINIKTVCTYKQRMKEKLHLKNEIAFYFFLFTHFRTKH